MIVYEVLVDDVFLGVVVNEDGKLSPDEALDKWNAQFPSYQGDTARDARFIEA